jgi:hypothetical protein
LIAAMHSQTAVEVMGLLSEELTAFVLWKIYELICKDMGGKSFICHLVPQGGAGQDDRRRPKKGSKDHIERFRQSVNSPEAFGKEVRHAVHGPSTVPAVYPPEADERYP